MANSDATIVDEKAAKAAEFMDRDYNTVSPISLAHYRQLAEYWQYR
jgi:hypothetical protein